MGSNIDDFSRYSFPDDFVFGTSSSAYQYEGETNKHGRGPAIWDTFTEEHTERINDHSNGNVAVDFYHRYKEDVQRMKEMGMDAFRFSISWSRVLPRLQPYVTLFHWDTPQALEDKYGGFLSPNIVNDFRDFVDLCFQKFGDRVKKWITLKRAMDVQCSSEADQNATKRSLDFNAWLVHGSFKTNGDYPRNMHDFVGGRLPEFTAEESKMLKGSYDFIGINYYTTYYAQNIDANYQSVGFMSDARASWTGERDGIPIGPQAGVKMALYLSRRHQQAFELHQRPIREPNNLHY
uniref:Linamarase family protein n=1 Tax=Populus alba TaxID=43335 RepID=A0A4V6A732_POPAL|nr:linamarase family protein [Populus alba]